MSWFEHLGEPLCQTAKEAEQYLTTELERAVPSGWTVERIGGRWPAWRVAREVIPEGEWPCQEYDIRISASLDFIIFTHGNKDFGPMSLLHQFLQNALVIEASALHQFGMAACLERLLTDCRPNEWGYS